MGLYIHLFDSQKVLQFRQSLQKIYRPESKYFRNIATGITDLDGFSHIIVLFHMHLAKSKSLLVTPFLDSEPHGVFATRSPGRPNPIGFSVVELEKIENDILFVKGVDILDGSHGSGY